MGTRGILGIKIEKELGHEQFQVSLGIAYEQNFGRRGILGIRGINLYHIKL